MLLKRKPKNRRFGRGHVLDVKLRTREVRAARIRLLSTALAVSLGTVVGLYLLWRGGEWALDQFVFKNDVFAIRELDVQTDGGIPVEQLQKWAGVKKGDNLLALDMARVKRDLELVPLIASVAVERILPCTLRVQVAEREPIAQVKVPRLTSGGFEFVRYHLDESGHVIFFKDLAPLNPPRASTNDNLPFLTGVNAAELTPGRAVGSPNLKAALRLITAFDHSPMAGIVDLQSVDVSGPEMIQVVTGQGSQVTFGLDYPEEQLRRWRAVHDFARKNGRAILMLDLSVTNNSPALWLDARAVSPPTPKSQQPLRNRKKHV
ncbi:MAG TPA: FtsQ-type POTRA domain-containing protein [Verrucomicrobiae bacterium]|nr:FtsQ-type POTRA domain-containing protein [Verrucomicrobiae bacterium]